MKKYFVSVGVDIATYTLIFLAMLTNFFLVSRHAIFKFISTTTQETAILNPEKIPPDSVLYGGIAYILFLLLITLIVILIIFILSRTMLFNYLISGKLTFKKKIKKGIKVFFTNLLISPIPLIIFGILSFIFQLFFFLSSRIIGSNHLQIFYNLIYSFLLCSLIIFFSFIFALGMKEKSVLKSLFKIIPQMLKNTKKYLTTAAYGAIVLFFALLIQLHLLSKIPIMHTEVIISGASMMPYLLLWQYLITLLVYAYLRIKAVEMIK